MNILENAEKYAEGKANQAITKAIADAYVEGYKAGYKDREEEIPMNLCDNKTEYVDLGLPSGTLWASDYEKSNGEYIYLPYEKAKRMSLPTIKSQYVVSSKIVKSLENTDFYELRISISSNEYRTILLAVDHDNFIQSKNVLLLNSFLKKDTKQYKAEIKKAQNIVKRYLED